MGWPKLDQHLVRGSEPANVLELVHEAYCGHFILTNLGLEPDEVTIQVLGVMERPGGPRKLAATVIARRAELQCVIPIAHVSLAVGEAFIEKFKWFIEQKRLMAPMELTRICHGTVMWRRRAEVIEALLRKGFDLEPGRMLN